MMARLLLLVLVALLYNSCVYESAAECTCPADAGAAAEGETPPARRLFEAANETCALCPVGAAAEGEPAAAAEGEPAAAARRLFASHEPVELCPAAAAGRRRLMASHETGEAEHCCCAGTYFLADWPISLLKTVCKVGCALSL